MKFEFKNTGKNQFVLNESNYGNNLNNVKQMLNLIAFDASEMVITNISKFVKNGVLKKDTMSGLYGRTGNSDTLYKFILVHDHENDTYSLLTINDDTIYKFCGNSIVLYDTDKFTYDGKMNTNDNSSNNLKSNEPANNNANENAEEAMMNAINCLLDILGKTSKNVQYRNNYLDTCKMMERKIKEELYNNPFKRTSMGTFMIPNWYIWFLM